MQKNDFGKLIKTTDWLLVALVLALCLLGLVTIANATCDPYAENGATGLAGIAARINPYYVLRQLVWIGTGLVLGIAFAAIDYRIWRPLIWYAYGFGVLLLIIVLFMPAGRGNVKNAIYITETLSFQPGELAKIPYILTMAALLGARTTPVKHVRELLVYLAVTALPVGLIIAEGEVGTALVFMCIFVGMMFLSGTDWKLLLGMGLVAAVSAIPVWFLLSEYQRNRILDFLDPSRNLDSSGYNVLYAKTATGTGRVWGKGLFREGALSQLDYVPEKHTDFIFSVTAEAVGLVGCLIIVGVLLMLLVRMLRIARTASDSFGSLICIGVAAMMFFHIAENICMNIGLLPVTGIPLPFLSYGGSPMWANMMGVGLALSVSMRRRMTRIRRF